MNQLNRQDFEAAQGSSLTSIGAELNATVAALRISREVTNNVRVQGRVRELPSRAVLAGIAEDLRAALFPSHFGQVDLPGAALVTRAAIPANAAAPAKQRVARRWSISCRCLLQGAPYTPSGVRHRAMAQGFADCFPLPRAAPTKAHERRPR